MFSKNKVKYIQSLRLKKFREKYNTFVVEGDKIIQEILQDGNLEVEYVCATNSWIETNKNAQLLLKDKLLFVSEMEMKKITALSTPGAVLAVIKKPNRDRLKINLDHQMALYLDDIQDPGNLGTILRIADWFGIQQVFCSPKCADLYNSKVLQSTMGAFLRINVSKINFESLKNEFPLLPIYGAVLEGKNIFSLQKPTKGILVIGNESKGINPAIIEHLTHKISIPRGENGGAESLNAAVATGIICAIFNNNQSCE